MLVCEPLIDEINDHLKIKLLYQNENIITSLISDKNNNNDTMPKDEVLVINY